jgi:deoxyribodipyrimidine photo-lyase
MNKMTHDTGADAVARFESWCKGETGFPIVDAGMKQMLATGWMHNRVRMIVASFLVKDLHLPWQWGAKFFMRHLVDGDIASNNHGWQWTAGTGTDASPYFRIFNPISQGERFDPQGSYVRQWIPELRELGNDAVHAPWTLGLLNPYIEPIVDHAVERQISLDRYKAVSGK